MKTPFVKIGALSALAFFSLSACSSSFYKGERWPANAGESDGLSWESAGENTKRWNQYCEGTAESADVPMPNYKNSLVKNVAEQFHKIAPNSFYMYPTIVNAYGLKNAKIPTPKNIQGGLKKEAHVYLTYLCGEFRDRATMIEAKLTWISKFNKLKAGTQPAVGSKDTFTSGPRKGQPLNVWSVMTADSYRPFLDYSRDLWHARQGVTPVVKMGGYNEVGDVDGMTVCQTKFIFNQIHKGKGFTTLAQHNSEFDQYSNDCFEDDKVDYYDFRGDSNFKPNTPEGNGMIWYANHIAGACLNTKKAKNADSQITDAVCEDYFRNPFRRRWQGARAGLATWMMHSPDQDNAFKDDYSPILILPHRISTKAETLKPFAYKVPDASGTLSGALEDWLPGYDVAGQWNSTDMGFNSYASGKAAFTFERLRDAVNRHTNWYQSQWDDGLGTDKSFRNQAYSPFVASSYEPSESDQFTFCGITVPCPPDGFKHWMFVFRVKGSHWYKADDIAAGSKPIDFSKMWLDETSLGTTSLADAEHAWDRLGTAMESELAGGAILYLHNITDTGSVSNDGLAQ